MMDELHHAYGEFTSAIQTFGCRLDSTTKLLMARLYVIVCQIIASKVLSCHQHDIGTLSWISALERAPTPLFGRLVRCSTHGCSFVRLRYVCVCVCMPVGSCTCLPFLPPVFDWLQYAYCKRNVGIGSSVDLLYAFKNWGQRRPGNEGTCVDSGHPLC